MLPTCPVFFFLHIYIFLSVNLLIYRNIRKEFAQELTHKAFKWDEHSIACLCICGVLYNPPKCLEGKLVLFYFTYKIKEAAPRHRGHVFSLYSGLSVNPEGLTLCQKHEAERNIQWKQKAPPHYCPQTSVWRDTQRGLKWRIGFRRPEVKPRILYF